jgi:sterol desaturase/sphingolipid hydroxylase (fatty acid hydroxylase superfamily)
MPEIEASETPRIHAAGIAALRATRPWALFVGIVALVLAAIGVINAFIYSLGPPLKLPPGTSAQVSALASGFATLSAIVGVVVYGLFGWFALQFARKIKASLSAANPEKLEEALWWQRRYWTLQGILLIVTIIIAVLVFIVSIIVGMHIAAADAG